MAIKKTAHGSGIGILPIIFQEKAEVFEAYAVTKSPVDPQKGVEQHLVPKEMLAQL